MSVHIQLNNPPPFYTNLDDISGRIILNLTSNDNISAIMVKLEGESKTVLPRPPGGQQSLDPSLVTQRDQRQGAAKEDHKLLYKLIKVFPSKGLLKQGESYMIRAGQHEYPFQFKIPLDNICCDPDFQNDHPETFNGGFYGQIPSTSHIKATLPPSLTSFPGEAEIRYFVKVTVQRPSRFKGNRRCEIGFKFMPIEPPRAPLTTNEVYARRPYMFNNNNIQVNESSMPRGEVDARLPSPAVLTCNKPVALRLVMRNHNEAKKQVYLLFFQMNLIGCTEVRALDVKRSELSFWVIVRTDGLAIPIGSPGDEHGTETVVDPRLWNHVPFPNTVTPSFRTCNLMRNYELEIRVGLGCESPRDASQQKPHTVLVVLRFQIEINSGLSPPAKLRDALVTGPAVSNTPAQPPRVTHDPAYPPQLGPAGSGVAVDAPPSYESHVEDEIAPVEGVMRHYSGVTDVETVAISDEGSSRSRDLVDEPPPFDEVDSTEIENESRRN